MQVMKGERAQFNPQMLTLAREARGLTQVELAERLSVRQGSLSRIEGGVQPPSEGLELQMGFVLGFPREFFHQTSLVYGLGVGQMFRRMRSGVSMKYMHGVCAQINLLRMHLEDFLKSVELPSMNIPSIDVGGYDAPADVAEAVRNHWHLPHGPVSNLTKVLEAAGGIVVPFDFGVTKIDALSICVSTVPPLFFTNTSAPADRLRFTLAHELGHVVMHQHEPNPDMEKEADQFAAEFLMPHQDIGSAFHDMSLPGLALQKSHWKVSMAALLRRAQDLGYVTPAKAKYLWQQMSRSGMRTKEPDADLVREVPTLYREIVDVFKHHFKYSPTEMARLLRRTENDVREMFYSEEYRGLKVVK